MPFIDPVRQRQLKAVKSVEDPVKCLGQRMCGCSGSLAANSRKPSHGSSSDAETLGNLAFADSRMKQLVRFIRQRRRRRGPAVALPVLPGLGDACFNAIPQDVALILSKHGQHPSHCLAARRREIQRIVQ